MLRVRRNTLPACRPWPAQKRWTVQQTRVLSKDDQCVKVQIFWERLVNVCRHLGNDAVSASPNILLNVYSCIRVRRSIFGPMDTLARRTSCFNENLSTRSGGHARVHVSLKDVLQPKSSKNPKRMNFHFNKVNSLDLCDSCAAETKWNGVLARITKGKKSSFWHLYHGVGGASKTFLNQRHKLLKLVHCLKQACGSILSVIITHAKSYIYSFNLFDISP